MAARHVAASRFAIFRIDAEGALPLPLSTETGEYTEPGGRLTVPVEKKREAPAVAGIHEQHYGTLNFDRNKHNMDLICFFDTRRGCMYM